MGGTSIGRRNRGLEASIRDHVKRESAGASVHHKGNDLRLFVPRHTSLFDERRR
jgi:hypothetical protein